MSIIEIWLSVCVHTIGTQSKRLMDTYLIKKSLYLSAFAPAQEWVSHQIWEILRRMVLGCLMPFHVCQTIIKILCSSIFILSLLYPVNIGGHKYRAAQGRRTEIEWVRKILFYMLTFLFLHFIHWSIQKDFFFKLVSNLFGL